MQRQPPYLPHIRALFCVGAFGVQILAMGAILQTATGISLIPAALIASIVTLAYTWSGGILAVTLTDAVQYVIIVIGVTLCGYLAIDHLGGFDAMIRSSTPTRAPTLSATSCPPASPGSCSGRCSPPSCPPARP